MTGPGLDRIKSSLTEIHLRSQSPSKQRHRHNRYGSALADLVITVDTSVAHLAGALGRPLWVLLPFWPDWRWTLDRASPWYPDARLFRQGQDGDWGPVIERVREELAA